MLLFHQEGTKYSNISVFRGEGYSSVLIQTPMLILTEDLLSPRLTFTPIVNVGVYNFLLSNGKKQNAFSRSHTSNPEF